VREAGAPVPVSVAQLKGLERNDTLSLPLWIPTALFDVSHRLRVPFRIEGFVPPPDAEIAGENAIVPDNRQVTAPGAGPANVTVLAAAGPVATPIDAAGTTTAAATTIERIETIDLRAAMAVPGANAMQASVGAGRCRRHHQN
jgi:hypothetical protein